ncbi:MAG: hypothetical protein COA99_18720 [Moraxellaceae bacterium]|nr:MAG: hypothetical protein COA99_18720 [Moraxellaceae bacterium]
MLPSVLSEVEFSGQPVSINRAAQAPSSFKKSILSSTPFVDKRSVIQKATAPLNSGTYVQ